MSDDDSNRWITLPVIAAALGIPVSAVRNLADFAKRLDDAESFRELVVEIILTELVNGVLSLASYLFTETLFAIDVIAQSFWASLVAPFGELYRSATDASFGVLISIRLSVESAVASTGLAAPFVALTGWVAVLLVVAVIVGVGWALLETYLPTEAITENLERAVSLAFTPFETIGRLWRGASQAVRGGDGGQNDA